MNVCSMGLAKRFLLHLIALLLVPTFVSAGPIYVYSHGGVTKFSSSPPPAGIDAKVFKPGQTSFSRYRSAHVVRGHRGGLYKTAYQSYITSAATKYEVEPAFIRAVIHAESSFNPRAISPKGAKGLMQLMDETRKRVGVTDVFSPAQNIEGGVRLLAILLKKYKGDKKLALAAYNAGEGSVSRYGGIPPYRETQHYVEKVLSLTTRYRGAVSN